jgi:glycosyltransferase involved in cell wall biosynthesis
MQEVIGGGSHESGSLSIIVPVYNPGQSLERLLVSLPDNPRLDIIFVDDGSTDGSRERLENFVVNRRAILVASSGRGPGTARNTGMTHAKGDFVAFADADDECRLNVLFDAVDDCMNFGADVTICGYELKGKRSEQKIFMPFGSEGVTDWVGKYSVLKERVAVWGKVYRRDFLVKSGVSFPDEPGAEDVVFSYYLALAEPRTRVLTQVGYVYFQDSVEQLTATDVYFRYVLGSISNLVSQKPPPVEARSLLGYVVLSSTPYLMRGGRAIPGFVQVVNLVFRTLRVIGFRALTSSITEIGKRRLTKWRRR